MKTFLVTLMISASAFASPNFLIQYQSNSGFAFHPVSRVVTVYKDGSVDYVQTDLRTQETKKSDVAQLSADTLEKVEKMIQSVGADTKLIDENKGKPFCMDAPNQMTVINKGGQEKTVFKWASCHTYNLEKGEGESIKKAIDGLVTLAVGF